MKETKFIEQNQEKWAEYEHMLQTSQRDPGRLNDLFIQITDDLSYARTFYPNRSVRVYLNHMAQRIFHNIYRGQRFPMVRFWRFWTHELPQVMWESRVAMRLALSIFLLSMAIGVVSSILQPDFARTILGDSYVDMTLENINNGDPMAVYKSHDQTGMAAGIAANNLYVAMLTALVGVLGSIGTIFMLVKNGIMVGVFQYFFIERGIFWKSFLAIWIHGTLEISAIIIAGGAGLVMGSGLLFPGTYTRTQAFQLSMRRGLKIMAGIAPIIMLAAFFEGFFTRLTDVPDVFRGIFILTNLAFVLFYFVWWPRHLAKTGAFENRNIDHQLSSDKEHVVAFNTIKSTGEIFSDVSIVLRRNIRLFLLAVGGGTLLFIGLTAFLNEKPLTELFSFQKSSSSFLFSDDFGVLNGVQQFFGDSIVGVQRWICFGIMLFVTLVVYRIIDREMPDQDEAPRSWLNRILSSLGMLLPLPILVYLIQMEVGIFILMLGIFFIPFLTLYGVTMYYERLNVFEAIGRTIQLTRFVDITTLGFLILSFNFLIFWFFDTVFWRFILEFFSWMVPSGGESMRIYESIIHICCGNIALWFSWVLLIAATTFYHFSAREIEDANALYAGIEKVGKSRSIRGLAKES